MEDISLNIPQKISMITNRIRTLSEQESGHPTLYEPQQQAAVDILFKKQDRNIQRLSPVNEEPERVKPMIAGERTDGVLKKSLRSGIKESVI